MEPETLQILLKDGSYKERHIGSIKEKDGKVIYCKQEDEAQIHRKSKSWSINRIVLDAVDEVEYETDKAIYRISSRKARQHGLSFKWDNKSFVDRKCFVPIKLWDITWKDAQANSLISLFGYEWYSELTEVFNKEYIMKLTRYLAENYARYDMYPAKENIFLPFRLTPFMDVKVVMVAPYAFPLQGSNGLAFGFEGEGNVPQVTTMLLKEIEWDIYQGSLMLSSDSSMRFYANQGVLMLNYVATSSGIGPCMNVGWEEFTRDVISVLNAKKENLVFMLYGNAAGLKSEINTSKHLVLINGMPYTPEYKRDRYFSICNNHLISKGLQPINW